MFSSQSRSSTAGSTSVSQSSSSAPPTKVQRLANSTPPTHVLRSGRPSAFSGRPLYARGNRLRGARHHLPCHTNQRATDAYPSPSDRIDDDTACQTFQPHTIPEPVAPSTPSSQRKTEESYRKKTFFEKTPPHTDQIFFLQKNNHDFFVVSDDQMEMLIPFPPYPHQEMEIQQSTDLLSVLSPVDKDVSWLYKTLDMLSKPGGLQSDVLQNDEILSRFSFLIPEIFTLASVVVKRLIVRISDRSVETNIERGVTELYKHVYFDVLKGVEFNIMKHLKKHISFISLHPLSNIFPLESDRADYYLHFGREHNPNNSSLVKKPVLLASLPWTMALSLVRTRKAYMDGGRAYFCYLDAPDIAKDAWRLGLEYWKRYEAVDLLLDAMKYTSVDVSSNTAALPYSFEYPTFDAICTQNKRAIVPNKPRFISSSATHNGIQRPNPSGNFLLDYKPIMPPCILSIVEKHTINKTHMKFEERKTFFSWCCKVEAPLSSVLDFWTNMLENERVDRHAINTLIADVRGLYSFLSKKDRNSGFKSCDTMRKESMCPIRPSSSSSSSITDIEDLKSECKKMCSAPSSFQYWSPILASKHLNKTN